MTLFSKLRLSSLKSETLSMVALGVRPSTTLLQQSATALIKLAIKSTLRVAVYGLSYVQRLLPSTIKALFNQSFLLAWQQPSREPWLATLQLLTQTLMPTLRGSLPEKLTTAARMVYAELPEVWKSPKGPLTEAEWLAVLRDALRLSRSVQQLLQR